MFYDADFQKRLYWQGKEVIKQLDDKPHLLTSIEIRGTYFPHRDAEPFVRIIAKEKPRVTSWFSNIAADNNSMIGYFPEDLPDTGIIEFGYGARIMGRLPLGYEPAKVVRLDRKRLPEKTLIVTIDAIAKKMGIKSP
jgi:hypothetical protein